MRRHFTVTTILIDRSFTGIGLLGGIMIDTVRLGIERVVVLERQLGLVQRSYTDTSAAIRPGGSLALASTDAAREQSRTPPRIGQATFCDA